MNVSAKESEPTTNSESKSQRRKRRDFKCPGEGGSRKRKYQSWVSKIRNEKW